MSESSSFTSFPAGPSSFRLPDTPPPPPEALQRDDYAAADQARQRLNKHGLFSSISLPLPHRHRKKSNARERSISPSPSSIAVVESSTTVPPDAPDIVDITEDPIRSTPLQEDYDKDVYRWAILYENQRGATMFSTPYYSPLTLLPLDPPPFTIPSEGCSPRRNQPTVSLEDYPLPDGSWKWVSRAWMIDMHGDGQVQYDGFEYGRSFRTKKWGPNPGFMSNRGLVRRRRWIRLMMRPAQTHDSGSVASTPDVLSTLPEFDHHEEGATRPPSVLLSVSDTSDGKADVWKGDFGDWGRCRIAMRRLGRDGRKIELWANWLGVPTGSPPSPPASWSPTVIPVVEVPLPDMTRGVTSGVSESPTTKNSDVASFNSGQTEAEKLTADTGVSAAQARREYVTAVIRAHGSDILSLFVYPDSRAKFLLLLGRVGLLPDIRAGWGVSDSVQILDFWSYTQDLGEDIGHAKS
ncbi:hypothetical protein C8Q80DRAFT_1131442 [Daedaleopsis nitida]|nr:hypothetical protein C8Q80DRAFT_1131442 [Daedaleopsis nitida]